MARKVTLTAEEFERLSAAANLQGGGIAEALPGEGQTQAEADLEASEIDANDDVLTALMELEGSGDCRWQFHRTSPSEKAGYVGTLPTAELQLETVAKKFGPGKYRVRGIRANGRYVGQRTIDVAPMDVPEVAAHNSNGAVSDVLAIIAADKTKQSESLKSWAAILVPVMAPIIAQMFTRKETSMTEMVATLQGLKAMQQPESPLGKIEEFTKLIEAVRGLVPEGSNTGSTWIDIVRDGIKEVGPALAGMAGRAALPAPVPIAVPRIAPSQPPAAAPSPVAAAETAAVGDPMLKLMGWLKGQLEYLILKAAANRDPDLYADLLLDNLPDDVDINTVRGYLSRADWWTLMRNFDNRVSPYEGWFTALRNSLLESIAEALRPNTAPDLPASDLMAPESDAGND